jgi:pentatricopeptide repeat protein
MRKIYFTRDDSRSGSGSQKPRLQKKSQPTDPRRITSLAKGMIDEGFYNKAIRLLENFLLENPKDLHAISLLIKAYGQNERFEDAKNFFCIVEKNGLVDDRIYFSMLNAYSKQNNLQAADELFRRIVDKGIDSSFHYGVMITLSFRLGKDEKAKEYFTLAKKRSNVDAFINRIMIDHAPSEKMRIKLELAKTGEVDEKEKFELFLGLKKVVKAYAVFQKMKPFKNNGWDSGDPNGAINDMINICCEKNHPGEAFGALKLAFEHQLADETMLDKVLDVYLKLKKTGKARKVLDFATSSGMISISGYENVVNQFRWNVNPLEVLKTIEGAPEEVDKSTFIRLIHAEAIASKGDPRKAIEMVNSMPEEELNLDTKTRALLIKCRAEKKLGNVGEAFSLINKIQDITSEKSIIYPEVLFEIVDIWKKRRYSHKIDVDMIEEKIRELLPYIKPYPILANRMNNAIKIIEQYRKMQESK